MDSIEIALAFADPSGDMTLNLVLPSDTAAEIQALFARFCVNIENSSIEIVAFAQFVEYTAKHGSKDAGTALFEAFTNEYCSKGENIHVCASKKRLNSEQMQTVLRTYYCAASTLGIKHKPNLQRPALFANPEFKILAMFGGQGGMDNYIEETRSIYTVYRPLVSEFVEQMAMFLKKEASMPTLAHLYFFGLDVVQWLEHPETLPHHEYMVSVPVCIPLVGLTQLMQVMVLFKTLHISPADLVDSFSAIAGHSQGITVASVLSMATDEQSFFSLSQKALGLLMLCGAFPQMDYPVPRAAVPVSDSENGKQQVTPMVSVLKLTKPQILASIDKHNSLQTSRSMHVHLSLANNHKMFVVSGATESLGPFVENLHAEYGSRGKDQTRVVFSQRKPGVYTKFLNINAPYHCELLSNAANSAWEYAIERGWSLSTKDMRIPVRAGDDGHDIRRCPDLVKYLFQSMCVLPVNWPVAVKSPGITHVVDFGPGGFNGFGSITQKILVGRGIVVVCAGAFANSNSWDQQQPALAGKVELYLGNRSMLQTAPNWEIQFGPKLVRTECDQRLHIETRMTRVLGKPPLMVAGMTPSTVGEEFVSAVTNAGYHVELSGGGHFSEEMLRDKVDKILKRVSPGHGITINSIYVNPFLWNTQYPAIQAMCREGIPMEGLCIGAGVPSFEVCNDIITSIRDAGFRHIGLKPGSLSSIRLVIKIAQANLDFPILLQWTGGRAGGHHSFEDFHQPILETYDAIRAQSNIVLVAGSGFGGVDDTLPYLTGEWSSRFGCAHMPFDGILLGSRVMVAKEGSASDAVKDAIVATPGIDDSEWEKTYKGPAGGIVTVLSEMGEPIHKIANRGMMLWKELDDTVFSLPREKRLPVLLANKNYIIKRLNNDFQKPWFGKKTDGTPADLEDMTYAEVANRLLEVLYVKHQSRWIDITLRNLVGDFMLRLEERFATSEGPVILQSFDQINKPFDQIKTILDAYPECYTQLLTTEDVLFFVNLCMRPGQKPVPFIPVMDKDFHIWFKKDSLWQSEDVDAVADQDAGRVCILQGPVAVRYSTKANEPVKDILDGIYNGQIEKLLEQQYGGDQARVECIEYLGGGLPQDNATPVKTMDLIRKIDEKTLAEETRVFNVSKSQSEIPDADCWFETLAGRKQSWLRALLTSSKVVHNCWLVDNIVRQALQPQPGQTARVKTCSIGRPLSVDILDMAGQQEAMITFDRNMLIKFFLFTTARRRQCALEVQFRYSPQTGAFPVHQIVDGHVDRIKTFYAQLWFDNASLATSAIGSTSLIHRGPETIPSQADVEAFRAAIGAAKRDNCADIPLDYSMRVFWPALCACLMSAACDGDLSRLVHVSNAFTRIKGQGIRLGSRLGSEARITEATDGPSGRVVGVRGYVLADGNPTVEIHTTFLFRSASKMHSSANQFRVVDERDMELYIGDRAMLARILSKDWFVPARAASPTVKAENDYENVQVGTTLLFRLVSRHTTDARGNKDMYITTAGPVLARKTVSEEWAHVADVDCEGRMALSFLERFGKVAEKAHMFSGRVLGSYVIHVPRSAAAYAEASGDHNAIHTHMVFAAAVGLPGPITHGMWTSAAVRGAVEAATCDGDPARMAVFSVRFVGVVHPGERLSVRVRVTGLCSGRLLVSASADSAAGRVLEASAEISMPRTALLFTGQGAQAVGMGMSLYESSPAARAKWDAADSALRTAFGIPLLRIVRDNPRSLTVHFAGARGAKVRAALRELAPAAIAKDALSYTFVAPRGLLHATQFSQAALLVAAVAEAAHLRALGAFPADAVFAGHSLGELAALAVAADIFDAKDAAIIGFVRGLVMQQSVDRDPTSGFSSYAMLAVNPARVAQWFCLSNLKNAVARISDRGSGLIEIVNYNVRGAQYIVAGDIRLLATLALLLNQVSAEDKEADITDIAISKSLADVRSCNDPESIARLLTTRATVPVPGIDIPFHSTLLRPGVDVFRRLLLQHMSASHVQTSRLRGLYIPNLTAEPFDVSKRYFELVQKITGSDILAQQLYSWDNKRLESDAGYEQKLAHILLVELLAFQIASPVRWIETQDVLLHQCATERFIEIGPAPILSNILHRTLGSVQTSKPRPMVLSTASDMEDITFRSGTADNQMEKTDSAAQKTEKSESKEDKAAAGPQPLPTVPSLEQRPSAPAALTSRKPLQDCPIPAILVLRSLIAYKLKCAYSAVASVKPIKDFVAGKSTLQNEIVGDLQKDFADELPEKPEEIPLAELADALPVANDSLGKHSQTLIARMIASKMPGAANRAWISEYLSRTYCLGPLRQQALLLVALTMEPAARLDSEASARSWLDSVASEYASIAGISYGPDNSALDSALHGSSSSAVAAVTINSEEFTAAQHAHKQLIKRSLDAMSVYLGVASEADRSDNAQSEALAHLDMWTAELGSDFAEGVRPLFSMAKARIFDSWWNWARQDIMELYYDIICGKISQTELRTAPHCLRLANRLNSSVIETLQYIVDCAQEGSTAGHALAYKYGSGLIRLISETTASNRQAMVPPAYQFTDTIMAPCLRISGSGVSYGSIEYSEVPRPGENSVLDFVNAVTSAKAPPASSAPPSSLNQHKQPPSNDAIDIVLKKLGLYDSNSYKTPTNDNSNMNSSDLMPPMVHVRSKPPTDPTSWKYDAELSETYADALRDICKNGISLVGKRALITGCGSGSIGAEVLKALLEAGANVIVTTSNYSRKATKRFEQIYQKYGARGSSLVVVPFNQASRQDVSNLVRYIYAEPSSKARGLGWDLDYVLPFAAIPEAGHDISDIGSQSELAHRAMLVNTIRLLGAIASEKQQRDIDMHPTLAVLPLSPNHGAFGYDGLYSESKAGLETLLERWYSETSWQSQISVAAAVIGWTRSTGLMSANNIVAECVERVGVRTFSSSEMAFSVVGLMHPTMYALASMQPVWADIAGRFQYYPGVIRATAELRTVLSEMTSVLKASVADSLVDFSKSSDPRGVNNDSERVYSLRMASKLANHQFKLPTVKQFEQLSHLHYLQGMVDLDKVVVVTGFGEVGPYGNAATRWEMEAFGEFSLEGCIELAWVMGLIKHSNAKNRHTGKMYTGWVDSRTDEPVLDKHIKSRYEKRILEHTGIRLIEPEMIAGYDPTKKTIFREVQIEHELEPFEATEEEARQFKNYAPDHIRIWKCDSGSGMWFVRFLKGATLMVPKALRFDRLVAAQLPTGWDPARYGIPKNIADQVDPVTCYAVVATVEALLRSGITDPYEIYKYVHVSEVGSSTGSALGGLRSTKSVFAERLCDKDQQPDVYQETFLSTPPAWINMLLMSASGPIKTTIGACATGIASIDVAVDTIQSGKAKIMLAGGADAFCEESSYEFAQMNATSNTDSEFAQGRTPAEMSRPCTSTRNGFMESEGAGIVVLMSASTAVKIGAPIYGIVAMVGTATDKEGRSVPAPGKGVLTSAREIGAARTSPVSQLLDMHYRRRQLKQRQTQIRTWVENEHTHVRSLGLSPEECDEHLKFVDSEGARQNAEALDTWGNSFWKRNQHISPLRGSLAVWGLTIDDVGIASFHGTSTKANDKNESEIVERQLAHLGRKPGNLIFSICQKYLTGHPKGPASIWMLNGVLQSLQTGIVPGNRNADNIASELEKCKYIVYPSHSIQTPGLKAGLIKSFGFGQVGAECLIIHPDYLLACLGKDELDTYKANVSRREANAYRHWHNSMTGVNSFVQIKDAPPYTEDQEEDVYLNPQARIRSDCKSMNI
ncbi:fatty acid synthase alpha subunit Lsd1 [Coemansia sp. IMI 203386]|nr:fatty acid synthase alpha subunit Lsd1 [Coemansia sp. IMI 203386]